MIARDPIGASDYGSQALVLSRVRVGRQGVIDVMRLHELSLARHFFGGTARDAVTAHVRAFESEPQQQSLQLGAI